LKPIPDEVEKSTLLESDSGAPIQISARAVPWKKERNMINKIVLMIFIGSTSQFIEQLVGLEGQWGFSGILMGESPNSGDTMLNSGW
jgi:hypothetical protein